MKPRVLAIVPAAGKGIRLGSRTHKPFISLNGRPLIALTLKRLEASPSVEAIVVAADASQIGSMSKVVSRYGFKKVIAVVEGGKERRDSVRNCLRVAGDIFDIIIIHDGARPFVDENIISTSVAAALKYGAAVAAVPESDTVKLSDKNLFVKGTLDRSVIYRAQTPQAFRTAVIKKAYVLSKASGSTDDSRMAEAAGYKVKIVPGSYRNIKITTREDLRIAKAILNG